MLILLLEYQRSSRFCMLKIINLEDSLSWLNPQEINASRSFILTKTSRCNIFIFFIFDEKKSSRYFILKISSRYFSTTEYEQKKVLQNFSTKSGLAVWMRPISILGGPISCKQSLKTNSTRLLVSRSKLVRHERLFLRN